MSINGANGGRDPRHNMNSLATPYEYKQRTYQAMSTEEKRKHQQDLASKYGSDAIEVFGGDSGRDQRRNELLLLANARNEERKRQQQLSTAQTAASEALADEATASADNNSDAIFSIKKK